MHAHHVPPTIMNLLQAANRDKDTDEQWSGNELEGQTYDSNGKIRAGLQGRRIMHADWLLHGRRRCCAVHVLLAHALQCECQAQGLVSRLA